jgi:hypothetical protein
MADESQYTPDIKEVCSCYVWVASENRVGKGSEYRAEFDRFIESIRAEERAKQIKIDAGIAEFNLGRVWIASKTLTDIAAAILAQLPEQDGQDQ